MTPSRKRVRGKPRQGWRQFFIFGFQAPDYRLGRSRKRLGLNRRKDRPVRRSASLEVLLFAEKRPQPAFVHRHSAAAQSRWFISRRWRFSCPLLGCGADKAAVCWLRVSDDSTMAILFMLERRGFVCTWRQSLFGHGHAESSHLASTRTVNVDKQGPFASVLTHRVM